MINSEFMCKVILIGDPAVGKTSILSRFISNKFTDFYCETIGVDFLAKNITFDNDKRVKCQFWDASGAEKYRSIISAYFKGATGIIAVYDITNRDSFLSMKNQLECYKNHILPGTTVMILGNKSDADDKRQVSVDDLETFINGNGFIGGEVSARFNTNLLDSMVALVKQAYYKNEASLTQNLAPLQDRQNSSSFSLPKITQTRTVEETSQALTNVSEAENTHISKSEFLNANSNSFLLANSDSFYNKNSNRKMIADLVEQVAQLKSDIGKKDSLIKELNSIDGVLYNNCIVRSTTVNETEVSNAEFLKKELDSKKERCEVLIAELSEANEKNGVNELVIADLKRSNEELRSEKESYELQMTEKLNKIASLEADLSSYGIVASKSELTINSLQSDNNQLNDKIAELKASITELEQSKLANEESLVALREELSGLKGQIAESLGIDAGLSIHQYFTEIREKVGSIMQENTTRRLNEQAASARILSVESESKVGHETVEKLVCDLNRSETLLLALRQEHEATKITLTAERDSALKAKSLIEDQIESHKKQHDSCQQELEQTLKKLESIRAVNLKQENELLVMNKQISSQTTRASCEMDAFREELSRMLSDCQTSVGSSQAEIKEAIGCLMVSSVDRGMAITSLQEELGSMADQLAKLRMENQDLLHENETNRSKITDLENSIRTLQTNLGVTISTRDQLDQERSRFTDFFQKLASSLQFGYSFDLVNQNGILKRIKDLLNVESDANRVQNKLTSIDYDQKLKNLEEELSNKEVHMNLLRNRIVDLEEGTIGKVYGKSELKTEYNNLLLETKKQKVKIQKISGEYNALKAENTLLKAEAMTNINLSDVNDQNSVQINELNRKISELSGANDKHLVKISEVREQNDSLTYDLKQTIHSSNEAISNLSKELRSTKQQLLKSETREKQLLEFRDIVCQKLGLNISSLSLGHHEYVANIENVINASHHMNNASIIVQQAQSQSLCADPVSARPCVTCPSWSSCVACMSKCRCSCQCNRPQAPQIPPMKYNCNSNEITEKTFQYQ